MAKFCGIIGFVKTEETEPGIWEEKCEERTYYGDIIRNTRNIGSTNSINGDVNINNSISIVADPFANENLQYMRYIIYKGMKVNITSVTIEYPRIILIMGGVYNGEQARIAE